MFLPAESQAPGTGPGLQVVARAGHSWLRHRLAKAATVASDEQIQNLVPQAAEKAM